MGKNRVQKTIDRNFVASCNAVVRCYYQQLEGHNFLVKEIFLEIYEDSFPVI